MRFMSALFVILVIGNAGDRETKLSAVERGDPTTAPAASPAATVSVTAFYRQHLPNATSGLLAQDELALVRRFLSRRLYSQYELAVRARQEWVKAHPDDPPRRIFNKPPCVEGEDYFQSLAEWPDVRSNNADDPEQFFRVDRTERRGDGSWHVHVHFWYDTTPIVEWTDVVIAVQSEDGFVIDDVLYSGAPFNRDGRLSELLKSCTEQATAGARSPGA